MLKGVVGLVTGGASGLGRATVERIVREGGKVTMCDLPTSQGAAVASAINSPNCIFVPTDITNTADVENALAETKVRKIFSGEQIFVMVYMFFSNLSNVLFLQC